jgi:hypothetical protein
MIDLSNFQYKRVMGDWEVTQETLSPSFCSYGAELEPKIFPQQRLQSALYKNPHGIPIPSSASIINRHEESRDLTTLRIRPDRTAIHP